jgi:3-oxoacyl-[acyl-carrier protein] reductase
LDLALNGKVAMIAGGSRGLGRQIADSLAREGCKVSICARNTKQLEITVAEFAAQSYQVHGTSADVTNDEETSHFHDDTIRALGEPDILVNCVGGRRGSVIFEETTLEQFRLGLEVNLISAFRLAALVVPHMKMQKWGRIINIASIYGREYGGAIDYMSAKAGLIAFSKHLALQLATYNVLVNCLAPGSIDFPGSSWDRFQKTQPPAVVDEFMARNLPMGRFGWPEPIGDLVAFLASDRADLITGTCINVDGGQSRSLF